MEKGVSEKALRLLTSPASLAAMAVLLVNDAVLRVLWPSWVTGKLGDFAWLLFFPFALAWGLGLVWKRREGLVRALAFGITGGVFALAKTLPAAHAAVVGLAEALLRRPVGWVRDPWDLVTLPALAAGWVMWGMGRTGRGCTGQRPVLHGRHRWRMAALAGAALLTVANSARPPSIGIECLGLYEGAIYSLGWDRGYVTRDGGLTWAELQLQWDGELMESAYSEDGQTWLPGSTLSPGCAQEMNHLSDVRDATVYLLKVDERVSYRYVSGGAIERSDDGMATWQVVYERRGSPADATYYGRVHYIYAFLPGPLDAIADPATGNVIFAMGIEGVLVAMPDGAWRWVAVGEARRADVARGEGLFVALQGELLLAVGFGLLTMMTLMTHWRRGLARKIFLGLFWLLWGANVVLMPQLQAGYGWQFDQMLMVGGCVYLLAHIATELALALPKQVTLGQVGRVALAGLAGAVVFLVPYVLWVLGLFRQYTVAAVLGVALGLAVLVLGWRWIGRGEKSLQPQAAASS